MKYQGLKINVLFPTLVGETEFPDCEALNRDLAAYVRNQEQNGRNYSQFTSVNNGWQSGLNFLNSDFPAIQTLKHFINDQIEIFLREWGKVSFSSSTPSVFQYNHTSWAVILRQGGFQHEHIHTKTDLVGIYYVEVPTAPATKTSGNLTLIDPRSGRVTSRSNWETAHYSIHPKPGMFLLFPSFLPHRVNQVEVAGERISINLDVTLRPSSSPISDTGYQ
ncbi:MAG: TIGR02466 family protein [Nostoc sp. EkiNYC01]|nr:TIGR02466 family protein [Nostoc sp. EkiNYC01]